MSYGICEIIQRSILQQNIDDTFLAGNMRAENLPFLNYVMSEQNRNASNFEIVGRGKKRTIQVNYDQAMLTSEVEENQTGCEATATECDTYTQYEFDTDVNKASSFTFSVDDLVGSAEENGAFLARKIQKRINLLKEVVSEDLATSAAAQLGLWSQDTANIDGAAVTNDILQVNTVLDNGAGYKVPNSQIFEQINMALDMSRFDSAGIFGASPLVSAVRRAMAGGTDDAQGYSIMKMLEMYGVTTRYDRHLTTALTSVNATNLAVGIGAIVPAGFSLYEGDRAEMSDDSNIATTIYDPETGMKFELRITRPCDDWNVVVRAKYQFYTWPNDLYKVGSNYEGVKSLAGIEVTCDDLQPCQA